MSGFRQLGPQSNETGISTEIACRHYMEAALAIADTTRRLLHEVLAPAAANEMAAA